MHSEGTYAALVEAWQATTDAHAAHWDGVLAQAHIDAADLAAATEHDPTDTEGHDHDHDR